MNPESGVTLGYLTTNSVKHETRFFPQLAAIQEKQQTKLCIGLDPDLAQMPACIEQSIFEFNKAIIDATHDLVCCYKPQIAHYAALGAEDALQETIEYIKRKNVPILLDAKRGDISSSAQKYADEIFGRYKADAVTINPYLGLDAMQPFLDYSDKGIFILCRTSNPGSADIQDLRLADGRKLYEHIATEAAGKWNQSGNTGLVVGATYPEDMRRIREICGDMTLLLPGVGAQGADIKKLMAAGQGGGMLVSSSRAIIFAGKDDDFAEKSREVATKTRDHLNSCFTTAADSPE